MTIFHETLYRVLQGLAVVPPYKATLSWHSPVQIQLLQYQRHRYAEAKKRPDRLGRVTHLSHSSTYPIRSDPFRSVPRIQRFCAHLAATDSFMWTGYASDFRLWQIFLTCPRDADLGNGTHCWVTPERIGAGTGCRFLITCELWLLTVRAVPVLLLNDIVWFIRLIRRINA